MGNHAIMIGLGSKMTAGRLKSDHSPGSSFDYVGAVHHRGLGHYYIV